MTDETTRHYYVDEAGDGTAFNAKGRMIIGNERWSKLFILESPAGGSHMQLSTKSLTGEWEENHG
jgi:hypothetical protein